MANEPSILPLVILVVVVVVGAGAAAGYVYLKSQPPASSGETLVQVGDNVTVTYIGVLGSGAEQGKVFDTSVYNVATNNATWPKALQFGFRGSASAYTQLDVHVGNVGGANYTVNNYSFIQVVPGFWQGIVGIPTNVTHTVVVPPNLGYPAAPCAVYLPLTFQVPVVATFGGTDFGKLYPGILATTGTAFTDPHYGWTVEILSANASSVTIENLAAVGGTSHASGWPVVVTSVNSTANGSGEITLVNQLSPSQAGTIGGTTSGTHSCGGASASRFIVTQVNLQNGTYTEDFNQEVGGQTLIFLVKVVNLFPPSVVSKTAA
ncbi:MAG TPA: hypothetical protein VJQ43_05460 [Thermoplasmata archaeon]|nr:hypothetical protein [Thermoplasmata archaeon]